MEEDYYPRRSSNIIFILLFLTSIILLTAHLTGYVSGIRSFLFYIIYPSPATATKVVHSVQGISQSIKDIVLVHQENLLLRKTLEKYYYMDKEYQRAFDENARLRNIVGFTVNPGFISIAARVTIRESASWFQWVVIDKGSDDGLFVNAPVLSWVDERLAVFGRIGEISAHSAKVVLITNVLSSIPVEIKSINEDGLLEGANSPFLKINYLLSEREIPAGAEIVTSPLSSIFPQGITVGHIQNIDPKGESRFISADIKSVVNFNRLREVVVLVPKDKSRSR